MLQRWLRLERYSQWKQCKFPLLRLPDDLVEYIIVSFMSREDMCRVIAAIIGKTPLLRSESDVDNIPPFLRPHWILHTVVEHFRAFLHSFSEFSCFHAFGLSTVCLFADWSPFSPSMKDPLAEYSWEMHPNVHFKIVLHEESILRCVQTAVRRKSCMTSIVLHGVTPLSDRCIMISPHALYRSSYTMCPYFIIRQC